MEKSRKKLYLKVYEEYPTWKSLKTKKSREIYAEYSHWKETGYHDYIEGLWQNFSIENPELSFTEYVRKHNHYNSLETAISLIEIWEKVKDRRKSMISQPMLLLGAIAGDVIGSVYEKHNVRTTEFPLFSHKSHFTDDSIMTVAVANKLLKNRGSYVKEMQYFGRRYPLAGYGPDFKKWISSDKPQPYGSYGNGSAMRVSPIGYAFNDLNMVLNEAERSAKISHNHPEGIKGAKAVASAVFLARTGSSKEDIRQYITQTFNYNLCRTIDEIRANYNFDISCQGSVPEAIISFLESSDFESSIRLAISIGGDSDTIACISGAIAEAFYKDIPESIKMEVTKRLPDEFLCILIEFTKLYKNLN